MFNAFKYHPEELDPCLASELRCDAEPSFPQRGKWPCCWCQSWLLARRWDPGAWVFLLLEKTENCPSLIPGDGLQKGRREHWGHFLVLSVVSGQQACSGRCHGSRERLCYRPCIREGFRTKTSGLTHQGQCLDRANISRCQNLGRLLLGVEAFCIAFWADSLWCLSPSFGDLNHPAQDSFLILNCCDTQSHQGLFQLWAKENIWLLPLFVSVVSLWHSCLQPGATWIPITLLLSTLLSL